ncbi:MAG TPA: hypothetical protein VFJ30_04740, partial [Phycisphaerae bacterium]|nr:hypothetical protein [Phycisphaerae bacterium]
GKRHVLNTPGSTLLCAIMMDSYGRWRYVGESFWSPDGRRLMIQSIGLEGRRGVWRTWLYTVPDDWP